MTSFEGLYRTYDDNGTPRMSGFLTIEEVLAPFDGHILYVVGTPPIGKGEPVAMIGAR